ncbi:notum homolog [Nannochloropsis oceanica]
MASHFSVRLINGLLLPSLIGFIALPTSVFGQTAGAGYLHKLNDSTGMAKCLDGSPMAYYYRPGTGTGKNKWLLSYEGGGWCSSLKDCELRTSGPLGSSNDYKPTTQLVLGKLSNSADRNPSFYNWNIVFVRYCDGGYFSGDVSEPVIYMDKPLYFRGAYIHRALLEDLMDRMDMAEATDVVISGCSAGAVQTYINIDKIRSLLPDKMRVTGLPDSGFLVAYDGEGACNYQKSMIDTFSLMNVSSSIPQGCLDKFDSTDQWRCMFFAQHLIPFIETPMFIVQSKHDEWQMDNNIYCEQYNTEASRNFGSYFEEVFNATINLFPYSGYLLDSCKHHCGGWDYVVSDDGHTQHEAFDRWYAAIYNDGNFTQSNHQHKQAGTYPCISCCVQGNHYSSYFAESVISRASPSIPRRRLRVYS